MFQEGSQVERLNLITLSSDEVVSSVQASAPGPRLLLDEFVVEWTLKDVSFIYDIRQNYMYIHKTKQAIMTITRN